MWEKKQVTGKRTASHAQASCSKLQQNEGAESSLMLISSSEEKWGRRIEPSRELEFLGVDTANKAGFGELRLLGEKAEPQGQTRGDGRKVKSGSSYYMGRMATFY